MDPRRRARAARRGSPRVPANRRRARPATERRRGWRARRIRRRRGRGRVRRRRPAPTPATGRRRGRSPTRSSRRSRPPAPASSSSSTRTSTSQQVLDDAANGGEPAGKLGRGRGTGLPTGRLPDRGVDRPPYPDEVQHARRYATRLRQAITQGDAADRQAHPGRPVRRPRLHTRPRRTGRRATGHHAIRGASPARSPRRSRSRTSG